MEYNTTTTEYTTSTFEPKITYTVISEGVMPASTETNTEYTPVARSHVTSERVVTERVVQPITTEWKNGSSLTQAQIRDAFNLFDRNGSGQIDATEMAYAMKALGFGEASKGQCESIIRSHDRDGNGRLSYHEFERLMNDKAPRWDSDEELRYIFNLFDKSGGGLIQLEELRETARYLGEDVDEQTLNRMIREADVLDHDGCVDYKEFRKIMLYGRRSIPGSSYTTTHVTYERSVPRQEYDEEY